MAADVTFVSTAAEPHVVPSNRSHDHSANRKRTGLELLHQRLSHGKCRALLAASEHNVWADTAVRMGTEDECYRLRVKNGSLMPSHASKRITVIWAITVSGHSSHTRRFWQPVYI